VTTAPVDGRVRAQTVPGRALMATVLAATAVVLAGQSLRTSDQPTRAVIWGGLALAAMAFALLFVIAIKQGTGLGLASWRLGPWVLVWYAVAFGLATVTWSQPQTGVAAEIAVSSVLRALWLVGVGMVIWALGYVVGPSRALRQRMARLLGKVSGRFAAEVRSPRTPWILYAIGITARLISIATTGHFGYIGDPSSPQTATGYAQFLTGLGACAPFAIAAAALQVYREHIPGARITLIVLFLSELGFGAAAGGKQSFVIVVLAVAIPFSAARRRLPKLALIAFPLIFMAAIIPFNMAYRNAVRDGSNSLTPAQAVSAAPGIFQQAVVDQSALTVIPNSVDYLLQRIREIDSPAIILQRTPSQIGFINPVQLVEAPVAGIVPRALWPGKPIMATGYQVSQEYYELGPTVKNSSAITPVGDLYRHGGWVPVLAGMFLLGCGVRLLDDTLDVRSNPHAIFLLILLFPVLVKNEVDWVTLVSGLPSTVIIWLLGVFLTFRLRRTA
jgi:hypothetical protein